VREKRDDAVIFFYHSKVSIQVSFPYGLVRYYKPFNIHYRSKLGFNWLFVIKPNRAKMRQLK